MRLTTKDILVSGLLSRLHGAGIKSARASPKYKWEVLIGDDICILPCWGSFYYITTICKSSGVHIFADRIMTHTPDDGNYVLTLHLDSAKGNTLAGIIRRSIEDEEACGGFTPKEVA